MTTIQRTITMFRSGQLLDGFKTWLRIKRRHLTYKLVRAIISDREVQKAFADSVSCDTPIGVALNEHIKNSNPEVEAHDICNLDRYVEDRIEQAMMEQRINVDDIHAFDEEVGKVVEKVLEDADVVGDVLMEVGRRLVNR